VTLTLPARKLSLTLLTIVAPQPLRDHPSRKGRHFRDSPCSPQSVGDWWLVRTEESDRRIDGDHLVIVREIGIEITIEREGNWGCIKRLVRSCPASDGLACRPSQQLVDVSNTLPTGPRGSSCLTCRFSQTSGPKAVDLPSTLATPE
jgi:hypothetical protein